jgi:hypothetical protein
MDFRPWNLSRTARVFKFLRNSRAALKGCAESAGAGGAAAAFFVFPGRFGMLHVSHNRRKTARIYCPQTLAGSPAPGLCYRFDL